MKKTSLILASLLISSSLQAGILDSISSGYGSVKDSIGGVVNSDAVKTGTGVLKDSNWSLSDLGGLADKVGLKDVFNSEAFEKLSGLGKGANAYYQYCYDFSPPSIKNPIGILNPCEIGDAIEICKYAPEITGFKKKSSEDLRAYCDALGESPSGTTSGGSPTVTKPKESVGKTVKGINTTKVLKEKYEKLKSAKSGGGSGGGSGGSSGGKGGGSGTAVASKGKKISGSSIDIKETKDNQEMQKVYYQNNYKAMKLLEDSNDISNDVKDPVDLSKISNGYKVLDDYKKSIEDLTQIYYVNENTINLTFLKNNADLLFTQINFETTDVTEQEKQKTSEGASLLKAFADQLDIWRISEIDKRLRLLITESEQVVNPSEEMLDSTNDTNTRIAMVYYGEKAKTEKAKIVADVESEAFDYLEKAKNIIEMAKIKSKTFDREAEYNKILTDLSSIK